MELDCDQNLPCESGASSTSSTPSNEVQGILANGKRDSMPFVPDLSESNISESEPELRSIFPDDVHSDKHTIDTPSPHVEDSDDDADGALVIDEETSVPANSVLSPIQQCGFAPLWNPYESIFSLIKKLREAEDRLAQKQKDNPSLGIQDLLHPKKRCSSSGPDTCELPFKTYGSISSDSSSKHLSSIDHVTRSKPHKNQEKLPTLILKPVALAPLQNKDAHLLGAARIKSEPCAYAIITKDSQASAQGPIPRKYQCPNCPYQTDNKSHLRRHFNSVHSSYKPYRCHVCGKESARIEKIKYHILKLHPGVRYSHKLVRKNPKELNGRDSSNTHSGDGAVDPLAELLGEARTYPLVVAGNANGDSSLLESQNMAPGELDPSRQVCATCGYVGKDRWHLKRHMAEVHDGEKEFKCPTCDYATSRKHRLISHMKQHGEMTCFYCPFTCPVMDLFMDHLNECTKVNKIYECTRCNQKFIGRREFSQHVYLYHRTKQTDGVKCSVKTEITGSDEFAEVPAHDTSDFVGAVDFELLTSPEEQYQNGNHEPRPYLCVCCSQKFPSEDDLVEHVQSTHQCNEDASTNLLSDLDLKRATPVDDVVVTGDLLTCELCDYQSEDSAVMTVHMQTH